jgi:hypothetical protein
MRASTQVGLRIAVGAGLIGVLFYFVSWDETLDHLLNISLAPAALAPAVLSLNIFVSSLKWKILLATKQLILSWWELARCYWIGTFFGNYLPTSVGGDIVRFVMLNRLGQPAPVAASILCERMTGFVVLLAWAAVALSMRPDYFRSGYLLMLLWLMVAAGILLSAGVMLVAGPVIAVLSRIPIRESGLAEKMLSKFQKFARAVDAYRDHKRELFLSVLLSVPFYLIGVVSNYLILLAVDAEVPLLEIIYILPIIHLITFLPLSLNGLGISEGAYVFLFSQAGISPTEALAAAFSRRAAYLIVSLVGGILWIPRRSRLAPAKDES